MISSMLKPVRIDAGLGNPPEKYTNNDVESANFMIKHNLQFDIKKPHEFIKSIKALIATQHNNEERAVFGRGPYVVAEKFKRYIVDDDCWGRMTHAQRSAKVCKFLQADMNVTNDGAAKDDQPEAKSKPECMQISAREADIQSVPLAVLETMFEKANKLLSLPDFVIPQPGSTNGSYIVAGHSNRIYCVKPGKGGSLVCDKSCFNRSTGICEHILAVAERKGMLDEFLNCFKRGNKGANITAMALDGGPKNAGKKPSGRKRTNKKKTAIQEYGDLLGDNQPGHNENAPDPTLNHLHRNMQHGNPQNHGIRQPQEQSEQQDIQQMPFARQHLQQMYYQQMLAQLQMQAQNQEQIMDARNSNALPQYQQIGMQSQAVTRPFNVS